MKNISGSWPCYSRGPNPNSSYIRVLHTSPNAPAVDIYANGEIIVSDLVFGEITDYVPVEPRSYRIEVFPAGSNSAPVIDTNVTVPGNSAFTIAAAGPLSSIHLMPIPEAYRPEVSQNEAFIRFVHLSPNAPAVDITLPDGTVLFENVKYQDYTDYQRVAPGTYTLQVRPTGSSNVVLTVPDVEIAPGSVSTVYAAGLVGGQPPLQALLFPEGQY